MRGRTVSMARLWFGLLGGHAAWSLHLLLAYFIASLACLPTAGFQVFEVDGFGLLIVLLTVAMGLVALAAAVAAFRAWRWSGARGWRGFMALVGLLLDGLFFATIVAQGVPLLYLDPCT
ncbi:MAG TPA: hypothetical protein VIN09_01355 [Chloroflexota bacterium]